MSNGQTHRDNINAELSGFFTSNAGQAPAAGGSFAFTETDMRAIIKNWVDLAHSYQDSLRNADRMARIKPPAEDFASRWHASAANRSGESYRDYLENNQNHCAKQAQLFQNALDDYLGIEHTNVTEMNKTAPQDPQPGI
jgi:hypothetical protein